MAPDVPNQPLPAHLTPDLTPEVTPELTFEAAIAHSQCLLEQRSQNALTDAELQAEVKQLVRHENGARGWFVVSLSDDQVLQDGAGSGSFQELLPAIVPALQASPSVVAPLMVKNLAMSTAMAIAHRRNQRDDLAQGSDRVRSRSLAIVKLLSLPDHPLPELQQQAQQLGYSLDTDTGEFAAFLQRWGYDAEQKQAIRQILEQSGLLSASNQFGESG